MASAAARGRYFGQFCTGGLRRARIRPMYRPIVRMSDPSRANPTDLSADSPRERPVPRGADRFIGTGLIRSCTRRRATPTRTRHRVRLQPSCPSAPEGDRLPLLPSGPDGVHEPSLRGTRLSTSDDGAVGERRRPRPGIQLRYSGLRIQGTASSPPSTTGGDGRPGPVVGQRGGGGEGGIRTHVGLPRTAFPVPRPRPLGDLSRGRIADGGEGGIRTHGGLPHTAFRERHLQPLGHLSARRRVYPTALVDWRPSVESRCRNPASTP